VADEELSRRELLEQAWGEAEKDEQDSGTPTDTGGDEPKEKIEEVTPPAEDGGEEPAKGEGKKEKVGSKEGKSPKERPDPDSQERKAAAGEGKSETKQDPVTDKPPNSWKPAVREHWSSLPKEVRETIRTRELQIQQELTQTGNIRKFAQEFANVVQPFQHIIRAQNSTPLRAVQNLLQTSAGLFQGSAEQKAEIVAGVIGTYGVDIKLLDGVLARMQENGGIRPPAGVTRPEAPPAWAKPLFDFMGTAEQSRQQYQQRLQQEANQEVEGFDRPFFDDLREEMADILEVAAKRGRMLTMEQAYDQAVALNPEISKIMQQRAAAEAKKRQASDPSANKRAASTIRGAPNASGAATAKGGKVSRREALMAAWEDAT